MIWVSISHQLCLFYILCQGLIGELILYTSKGIRPSVHQHFQMTKIGFVCIYVTIFDQVHDLKRMENGSCADI